MLILVKSLSWTALTAMIGAALWRYWLAPDERPSAAVVWASAAALALLALAELWLTLTQVIPTADLALWWRYATTTAHGHAVAWRLVAAALFALATTLLPRRGWPVALVLGVWLCFGFSRLSHAAAMGGSVPLLVDLAHLLGAATWAGAVWWVGLRRGAPGLPELERVSRLATWVVAGLALTGVLSALVHAGDPPRFFASTYAAALAVKLGLVAVTLGLAAANRFVLLPRARAGGDGIRSALHAESVLLAAVLVATAWLSTSPVPHGAVAEVDVLENARRVIEHLTR
ncbi:MAG TPA: CopD family protein [Trueperaceae bacterium]|nr:CopD family protein [Trueperaceae bacterium]